MARNNVFISYSRAEKQYLNELLPVLRAGRSIADVLWFDAQEIDVHNFLRESLTRRLRR